MLRSVLAVRPASYPQGMYAFDSNLPGDDEPTTVHLAARDIVLGVVVSVLTLRLWPAPAAVPEALRAPGLEWQLHGMATDPKRQGTGVGRIILLAAACYVRQQGGGLLWANCRKAAVPFYAKCGWSVHGDDFDVPTIGWSGLHQVIAFSTVSRATVTDAADATGPAASPASASASQRAAAVLTPAAAALPAAAAAAAATSARVDTSGLELLPAVAPGEC